LFDVPDRLIDADWWGQLAPAVAKKKPGKNSVAVAIGDSKKLYSPAIGLTHLERGVLGVLGMMSGRVGSLRSLMGWLCPPALGEMDEYPWYHSTDVDLPTAADPAGLRLRAKALACAMQAVEIKPLCARCEVVEVGRFNRLIAATNNKATTLTDQTCRLIDWVWRSHRPGQNVTIYADRQGGRQRYLPMLQRMFSAVGSKATSATILAERPACSAYRLTFGSDRLEVHFQCDGEGLHMPVALASMTSKYIRELFMVLFNRYWADKMQGAALKPTAGYYTDAHRFLADIDQVRKRLNSPADLLIRSR